MDTKWKNRKSVISFIVFFLGISLTLGSITDILDRRTFGVALWQIDRLLEDDYQQTKQFRNYISNRLENLLIMATGGRGLFDIWGYENGIYFGRGYYDDLYSLDIYREAVQSEGAEEYFENSTLAELQGYSGNYLTGQELIDCLNAWWELQSHCLETLDELRDYYNDPVMLTRLLDTLEEYQLNMDTYLEEIENHLYSLGDLSYALHQDALGSLSEEQRQKIAQKYHDSIKEDQNLLYAVYNDGKALYSNSDLLTLENGMNPPEGYNFLLCYDGEKVRILKDGKELDVYGDGYYREDSDWYVPGYRNFQNDSAAKNVTIYMAASREPVIFTKTSYENGGASRLENELYWMHHYLLQNKGRLHRSLVTLALGLGLLMLSFFGRKSRRGAVMAIARFQSKIWVECKALLFLLTLYALFLTVITNNTFMYEWQEISFAYEYEMNWETLSLYGRDLAANTPPLFWILLFWSGYLVWVDLRHNKKMWKHGLIAKLHAAFSAKGLKQPLARKMAIRNAAAFAAAALYGLLMLGGMLFHTGYDMESVWGVRLLCVFAFLGFLLIQYRTGVKIANNAKEMDVLSQRIAEIRNGNYKDTAVPAPGQDLADAMTQLDDIRNGMANAVDEQMRSERMKVELIANVSHDIKTPLTSIISYVEFLKQEENLPTHVKDYVAILDAKSQRLKNMVQDIFAVSKAASGELPVHMEALDFGKLLLQTMADMEEQISESAVTFRTELPNEPVMIMADGQRLYRVFQNLFQNAIKYSLQGSRVYVTLRKDGVTAIASVKNTSQIEPEKGRDFTERFTRGDQSRTDGGSGLGLSIAQSFTEACGGKFYWETDADLFIVKITFQTV